MYVLSDEVFVVVSFDHEPDWNLFIATLSGSILLPAIHEFSTANSIDAAETSASVRFVFDMVMYL